MSDLRHGLILIGCGQIGRVHAERLRADGRALVTVLCDPQIEHARRLRDEYFPDAIITGSVEEGLNLRQFDGAIVATPTHLHASQTESVMLRGVPVLSEKPLAESREKILDLIEYSERPEAPELMVGYQRRFWSCYRTIKREIDSGQWGKILSISMHNSEDWKQSQALPGTWRNDPLQNPGGFIGDAGSHKIDMILNLTGSLPVELRSMIDYAGSRVPIRGMVIGKLEGGVDLSLSLFGDAHHFREDLHIVMERADVFLRNREVWMARDRKPVKVENPEPDSDATRGFVDMLEGNLKNAAPAQCALKVWDFTSAILESGTRAR